MLIDGVGLVWECSMGLGMLFPFYLDIVKSYLKKISNFEICLENAFSACEAEFGL